MRASRLWLRFDPLSLLLRKLSAPGASTGVEEAREISGLVGADPGRDAGFASRLLERVADVAY